MHVRSLQIGLTLMLIALVACVPAERTRPAKEKAGYHYMMGTSALNENNPTKALKELLQAEQFDASDARIQAALGQTYWQKQAHDLAEKHLKNAISLSDNDPRYHQNLAALYLSMQRYDDAIRSFTQAAENLLFDRPEMAWTGVGLANFQKQDYPAAQQAYEQALAVNSRYYLAYFHLGELYYSQDKPAEALVMFTRTLELAPGFASGHYWQGLVFMKMHDPDNARKAFLEVMRLAPQSESAHQAANHLKIIGQ